MSVNVSRETKKKERGNKMLLCTACPASVPSDAEMVHPFLQVPICGACSAALKDADLAMIDNQIHSCAWCGNADDINLFMCDSCPRSFCEECIARNFGKVESDHVKGLELWSCYICIPTPKLKSLQVNTDTKFFNIDSAYNSIRPPNVQEVSGQSRKVLQSLTPEERSFVMIFSGSVGNRTIHNPELIGQYLSAIDFSMVLQVSTGIRKYFHSEVTIIPGLFKTEYGAEHGCRLFNHQIVSLNRMTQIENASKDFGALRGGIFGDEPGLGKTVTTLALVASTAGLMPQQPAVFWDKSMIDEHWALQKGSFGKLLGPVLNTLQKSPASGRYQCDALHQLRVQVEKHCGSVGSFESAVRKVIQESIPRQEDRNKLLDIFRQEMIPVKEGLDRSTRKNRAHTTNSPHLRRIKVERALCPSSATLIVVPLALLEHWYEQIKRHLNLNYFTYDGQQRGLVYLDGLGDIVDVEAPLSKLAVDTHRSMQSVQFLSHYMIVVTTFERCAAEYRMRTARGNAISAYSEVSLLQMRWLRLVVDEGHEIGVSIDHKTNPVGSFISQIAAERRWVMSGTPTTGSKSDVALDQLYRLMQFLRHPRLVNSGGSSSGKVKREGKNGVVGSKRKASTLTDTTTDTATDTSTTTSTTTSHLADADFISTERWHKEVVAPCLAQQPQAWDNVVEMLKTVLLRHTKNDIHLFDPIRSTTNLELGIPIDVLQAMTPEERTQAIDICKANHITDTMNKAKAEYRNYLRGGSGSGVSDAHRRSILNRMNHSRLSNGGGSGSSGDADGSTSGESSSASNGSDNGVNASVAKKVFTLAELMAAKNKNTNTTAGFSAATTAASINRQMLEVTEAEKQHCGRVRVPKAIVFSESYWQLQGVGHNLILRLGQSNICEHHGMLRSSELSRFRHSKKRFRECPMCGYCNQIDKVCTQVLLLVEYTNVAWLNADNNDTTATTNNAAMYPAEPAGHGRAGPGGHYLGKCLCSPQGCIPPPEHTDNPQWFCGHLPNPFYKAELVLPEHFNHAIVSNDHIDGYVLGRTFNIGDHVFIRRQNAYPAAGGVAEATTSNTTTTTTTNNNSTTTGHLWSGGVLGGHAIVRGWRQCGGKANVSNWHGDKMLTQVPWRTEHEDASVLLLESDGSTGLDLSFATHIFLLNRIKDPALRNQIVSRAHRMGAQGPVKVELVQVALEEGDGVD